MTSMSQKLLRRREVEQIVGLSRSTIYAAISTGRFPRPVRVGSRGVRWRLSDVLLWMASRPMAGEEDKTPGDHRNI